MLKSACAVGSSSSASRPRWPPQWRNGAVCEVLATRLGRFEQVVRVHPLKRRDEGGDGGEDVLGADAGGLGEPGGEGACVRLHGGYLCGGREGESRWSVERREEEMMGIGREQMESRSVEPACARA